MEGLVWPTSPLCLPLQLLWWLQLPHRPSGPPHVSEHKTTDHDMSNLIKTWRGTRAMGKWETEGGESFSRDWTFLVHSKGGRRSWSAPKNPFLFLASLQLDFTSWPDEQLTSPPGLPGLPPSFLSDVESSNLLWSAASFSGTSTLHNVQFVKYVVTVSFMAQVLDTVTYLVPQVLDTAS